MALSFTFRLSLILIFFLPFQARFYKFLKPLSLSFIRPEWSFPLYFERYADLFLSDLFLMVLLGWSLYRKQVDLQSFWQDEKKYLTIFLALAGFSILMSDFSSYALSYWRWGHLLIAALFVYCLRFWITASIKTALQTIAMVVVLSGILECCVALPQYFLQHQLGLKMVGEPTLVSNHSQAPHFLMPKGALTSLDYLLKPLQEPSVVLRAAGTLPHPNILGGFLVFSLLMTFLLYEKNKKGWIAIALIIQVLTLFVSYSRAALFALMGATLIWFLLYYLYQKKIPAVWKPLVLGFVFSVALFFPQLFYRGGIVSYNQLTQASDGIRVEMQNVGMKMIQDYPWLGVGFNHSLIALSKYETSLGVQPTFVHNIYLLIGIETGGIGLAFFLIYCANIVWRGWQSRRSIEGCTLFAILLAFLAIGLVDHYPIVNQQTRLIFFLVAGLASLTCQAPEVIKPSPALSRRSIS